MDPSAAAKPSLRIVAGPGLGQAYELDRSRLVVGRSETADIPLPDTKTSREHVVIDQVDGAWRVQDLGSRNGTLLNGGKLGEANPDPVVLQAGDRIRLGLTELEFVDPAAGQASRLRILDGPRAGAECNLRPGRTIVGRIARECDLPVEDLKASREHCEITCREGSFHVRDLASRNGTTLNGDALAGEARLASGDLLRIGQTVLQFLDARVEGLLGASLAGRTLAGRVGSGSQGVVFRAVAGHDTVAIRVLDPGRACDARAVEHFLSGAQAQQRVAHPNVVAVNSAETVDGHPLMVMEWLGRGSLAERLAAGDPVPADSVVSWARDIVRGLQAAGRQGLAHNGLRPGDVLFDLEGTALVGDFATGLPFVPGQAPGGPPATWIAPEEGLAAPTTTAAKAKANQFQLGCLLYQALTGRVPFAAADRAATIVARREETLPRILGQTPAVPNDLVRVLGRMLARAPEHRYSDWDALLEDLEALAAGRPIGEGIAASLSALEMPSGAPRSGTHGSGRLRRSTASSPRLRVELGLPPIVMRGVAVLAALLVVVVLLSSGDWSRDAPRPPAEPAQDVARAEPVATPAEPEGAGIARSARVPTDSHGTTRDAGQRPAEPLPVAPDAPAPVTPAPRPPEPPPTAVAAPAAAPQAPPPATAAPALPPKPGPAATVAPTPPKAAPRPRPEAAKAETPRPEPAKPEAPRPDAPRPEPMPAAPKPEDPRPTAAREPAAEPAPAAPARPRAATSEQPATIALCRPQTWEKGTLLLADQRSLGGEFQLRDAAVAFRANVNATEQVLPLGQVAGVAFDPPRGVSLAGANDKFKSRRYADALEGYEKALAKDPAHPWLAWRVAEATRLKDLVDAATISIATALATGDSAVLLDQLAVWSDASEATRLEPAWKEGLEKAWAVQAGKLSPEERNAWLARASTLKVKLEWDEQAPAYLAEAVHAADSGAPARDQIRLFQKAIKANAPFADRDWLLLAKAYHANGNPPSAAATLQNLSSGYSKHPEVEALLQSLGQKMPALKPQLVAVTYVGGAGDQHLHEVGFTATGGIFARGKHFTVLYDAKGQKGTIQGDIAAADDGEAVRARGEIGAMLKDPRNGQTYSIGHRQVHPILQQPFLTSSAGWRLWGWSHEEVAERTKAVRHGPLMADSRGYDLWMMPGGRIGAKCWTDGGNSTLTRDPRDLAKDNAAVEKSGWMKGPGGMGSMFLLIDPKDGTPLSGTFLPSHITHQAVDTWGRVYLPRAMNQRFGASAGNTFGMRGKAGLFVLDPTLGQAEFNATLGGLADGESGQEHFTQIALRGNLLVLGGTTCAAQLPVTNAVQAKPGGGQDGFLVILKLWE